MDWALLPMRHYAQFWGRSRRREFWTFILFLAIGCYAPAILLDAAGYYFGLSFGISAYILLAGLIPLIAVSVRRLHDTGRSGWWLLAPWIATFPGVIQMNTDFTRGAIVAVIGEIVGFTPILYFLCRDGTWGDNRFGPRPETTETKRSRHDEASTPDLLLRNLARSGRAAGVVRAPGIGGR